MNTGTGNSINQEPPLGPHELEHFPSGIIDIAIDSYIAAHDAELIRPERFITTTSLALKPLRAHRILLTSSGQMPSESSPEEALAYIYFPVDLTDDALLVGNLGVAIEIIQPHMAIRKYGVIPKAVRPYTSYDDILVQSYQAPELSNDERKQIVRRDRSLYYHLENKLVTPIKRRQKLRTLDMVDRPDLS